MYVILWLNDFFNIILYCPSQLSLDGKQNGRISDDIEGRERLHDQACVKQVLHDQACVKQVLRQLFEDKVEKKYWDGGKKQRWTGIDGEEWSKVVK